MSATTKTIKVKVLKKHITNGKVGIPESCPVALAISAKVKEDWKVASACAWPCRTSHFWSGNECESSPARGKGKSACVPIPPEAREFIKAFDKNRVVEPFEFEMELPA